MASNILCIVSENQTFPFRILNPHLFPVLLHPKTTIGTIDYSDEISSIQIVELIDSNSQQSSFSRNTWGPQCNFNLTDSTLNEDEKVRLKELLKVNCKGFTSWFHVKEQ